MRSILIEKKFMAFHPDNYYVHLYCGICGIPRQNKCYGRNISKRSTQKESKSLQRMPYVGNNIHKHQGHSVSRKKYIDIQKNVMHT